MWAGLLTVFLKRESRHLVIDEWDPSHQTLIAGNTDLGLEGHLALEDPSNDIMAGTEVL